VTPPHAGSDFSYFSSFAQATFKTEARLRRNTADSDIADGATARRTCARAGGKQDGFRHCSQIPERL
jgi:hypothetical protein